MLKCLRMMDEMYQRVRLYVSTNGKHSDLSIEMVVTFLGKSTSFRVMFFALVRNCWL